MINTKMKPFLYLALAVVFIFPAKSEALTTSAQHAFKLSNTQALFVIEYDFGTRRSDFFLPLLASTASSSQVLTYTIEKDGEPASAVKSSAVILSPLTVSGYEYVLPAGHSAKFTLAVVVETEADERDAEYRLRVDWLPFETGPERTNRHVDKALLASYLTPAVELNRNH